MAPHFTSDDVKFTFERMVDPATRSPWISIFSVIKAIEPPGSPRRWCSASPSPFSPFLNYLATIKYSAIVSREDVRQRGDLIKGGACTRAVHAGGFPAQFADTAEAQSRLLRARTALSRWPRLPHHSR